MVPNVIARILDFLSFKGTYFIAIDELALSSTSSQICDYGTSTHIDRPNDALEAYIYRSISMVNFQPSFHVAPEPSHCCALVCPSIVSSQASGCSLVSSRPQCALIMHRSLPLDSQSRPLARCVPQTLPQQLSGLKTSVSKQIKQRGTRDSTQGDLASRRHYKRGAVSTKATSESANPVSSIAQCY